MKTLDVELAVAKMFDARQNLIVPNVSWGLWIYECDLLVMTGSGYLYEVEIKVSKSDLIRDKLKGHGHVNSMIKKLYFAIPEKLIKHIEHIPERAGIIVCKAHQHHEKEYIAAEIFREAQTQKTKKVDDAFKFKVARLGALRIWTLKQKIKDLQRKDLTNKARVL